MSAKKRRAKPAAKPVAEKHSQAHRAATGMTGTLDRVARGVLWAGVALGAFGVPSVLWLGLRNPFGSPKVLVLALAAALSLVGLALERDALACVIYSIRRSRTAWALTALCALAALSTVTAIDPRQALLGGYPDYRGLLSVFAYAAVGAGALALWARNGAALWLGRGASACLLLVGALGALQRAGVFPVGVRGDFGTAWRVSSTLGNSSNLGVFLVVILPIVAWTALNDTRRGWRVLSWIATGLGALSLVWTLSRGAWLAAITIALVGGAALIWSRRGPGANRRTVLLGAGVALIVLVAAVALTPTFSKRASRLLDSGSTTGAWRLSTWRSAAAMTMARPFLGFGPNQFRYAYPQFQAPGQIDGRTGYPVVESAHNLEADTGTSFGLLGLVALLAVGVTSARVVLRSQALRIDESAAPLASASPGNSGLVLALGLGLLGGAVALQFHYVTMDTGPLLAVVLAGLVGAEAYRASEPMPAAQASRHLGAAVGTATVAVLYLAAVIAASGLIGADRSLARADTLVRAGAPWKVVSAELARAEGLAFWEPQVVRSRGTLATAVVAKRFNSAAALEGIRALDAASGMTPADAVLAAERGNLLLAAGVAAKDRALLDRSVAAFAEAERMDPNTGIAMAGRASALLALHRTAEAIALFRRALELSPRYAQGWRNLAIAYRESGRMLDAKRAEARAKKWAQ